MLIEPSHTICYRHRGGYSVLCNSLPDHFLVMGATGAHNYGVMTTCWWALPYAVLLTIDHMPYYMCMSFA